MRNVSFISLSKYSVSQKKRTLRSTVKYAPQSKMQYIHSRLFASYFFFPWRIHAKVTRRSILLLNLRQYLLYQTWANTTFSMGVDWSQIVRVMEVSAMLYKCTYCVFTLYGRNMVLCNKIPQTNLPCFLYLIVTLFTYHRQKTNDFHLLLSRYDLERKLTYRTIYVIFLLSTKEYKKL